MGPAHPSARHHIPPAPKALPAPARRHLAATNRPTPRGFRAAFVGKAYGWSCGVRAAPDRGPAVQTKGRRAAHLALLETGVRWDADRDPRRALRSRRRPRPRKDLSPGRDELPAGVDVPIREGFQGHADG